MAYYEDSIALLKRDNDGLKGKLVDTETMLSMEMNDLKVKLNSRHDNEID